MNGIEASLSWSDPPSPMLDTEFLRWWFPRPPAAAKFSESFGSPLSPPALLPARLPAAALFAALYSLTDISRSTSSAKDRL